MAKPQSLDIGSWNDMVGLFHKESDRGAAILAGSFLEHALGTFLRTKAVDATVADKLFGPVGPLSSFSQRITVAYAFRLISKRQFQQFEAIRQARNHFAHHPLNASFSSPEVQRYTSTLPIFNDPEWRPDEVGQHKHRLAYLISCGVLVGGISDLDEYKRRLRSDVEEA